MQSAIFYTSATCITGRELARELHIDGRTRIPPKSTFNTLIRWGAVDIHGASVQRVINRRLAVQRASNKRDALLFWASEGLSVPRVVTYNPHNPDLMISELRGRYPWLAREAYHVGGTDIVPLFQWIDLRYAIKAGHRVDHLVQYIPYRAEFRVHVGFNQVDEIQDPSMVYIRQKLCSDPTIRCPWIRNLGSGYRYADPDTQLPEGGVELACTAVQSLGLHFGAVDLLWGEDDNLYVLEVNTAPGLDPTCSALQQYVGYFKRILCEQEPEPVIE